MIGLATFASATRPAEGSYVFEYEEAAFSFVSTVLEASTCVENDQPSASAGVVSWLGILGITVLIVLLIVATIFTYSAWLCGYAPTNADAEVQI